MTYDETVELEKNVAIKSKANKIYFDFIKNVQLKLNQHQGNGKFKIWSDSHNAKYVIVHDGHLEYVCSFLHENYAVPITPEGIFNAIKKGYRGVEHLEVDSKGII